MKFRARTVDMVFIRTFAQLLSAISRCSRSFVFRIQGDKLIFVLSDKETANAANAIHAWIEIPKEPYFAEYAMEGVSAEDNQIFLEISPEKIAGCLSSLRSAHNVAGLKIKLTKKVVACLTFEIEFQSLNSDSAPTCIHDVPITLVLRRFWNQYNEPAVPDFNISVQMPEMKLVRLALERLKNLGTRVTITANAKGKMHFTADSYNVKCTVKFSDLRVYDISAQGVSDVTESESDPSPTEEFSVEVDTKTLIHVISSDLHKPSNFVMSLCQSRNLHLYYLFGEVSMQYCVPCIGETT